MRNIEFVEKINCCIQRRISKSFREVTHRIEAKALLLYRRENEVGKRALLQSKYCRQ
jgi:hypothetical protein